MTTARNSSGPLRQHRAHQQPAIRAAHDAEPARAGDAAADQVLGDRDEIVEGALAVALQRGLVPVRAELAAAADIGDDIDAALFQPQLAERAGIGRGHRHLEPAIAVEQRRRRAVERAALSGGRRNRAPRCRPPTPPRTARRVRPVGVEARRQRLDRSAVPAAASARNSVFGRQIAGDVDKGAVVAVAARRRVHRGVLRAAAAARAIQRPASKR